MKDKNKIRKANVKQSNNNTNKQEVYFETLLGVKVEGKRKRTLACALCKSKVIAAKTATFSYFGVTVRLVKTIAGLMMGDSQQFGRDVPEVAGDIGHTFFIYMKERAKDETAQIQQAPPSWFEDQSVLQEVLNSTFGQRAEDVCFADCTQSLLPTAVASNKIVDELRSHSIKQGKDFLLVVRGFEPMM